MRFTRKHLLDLQCLQKSEIELILNVAGSFKEISERAIKKVPILRGKTVVNLFFEPSTRTAASFDLAAKRLSADTVNVSSSSSSVLKGETLLDTARNLERMRVDMVVIRHSCPGAPHFLAERIEASVVNAGDGAHEHPTQGLLDLMTVKEKLGTINGLKYLIIGDILNSRVARSDIWGFQKLGAEVAVCGPRTLIPPGIERLGVKVFPDLERALRFADVINVLRIQLERQQRNLFPSLREYQHTFGITRERLAGAKDSLLIMHPGPINRGIEIESEVADCEQSLILNQVTNGLAIRMAVLYLLSGGEIKSEDFA
jgi:aspartate carbamoyltransferase catalytic subunit